MNKIGMFMLASWLLALCQMAGANEPAQAQNKLAENLRQACRERDCQHNVHVLLRKKDGTLYDRTFEILPPVVQDLGVTILAGQTVHIEAEISGNRLINYRSVEKIVNPDKTITATLVQAENGGMMLSIDNPFKKTVKFHMGIMPLDAERLYRTSSCPVMSKKGSVEMWPYPIFQVVLASARLMEDSDGMACVE